MVWQVEEKQEHFREEAKSRWLGQNSQGLGGLTGNSKVEVPSLKKSLPEYSSQLCSVVRRSWSSET